MIIGIVGKPNCGKSTFFKSLTLANVLIANYPFATIEPNKGFAYASVKCADSDFGVKCNPRVGYCTGGLRFVPVEVIDVAGLVPGAHHGKGLGNKFLDDLNHADALIHVVDASGRTNERGEYIGGQAHDPVNDVKFLEDEIHQWMFGILIKAWERFARATQATHQDVSKAIAKQMSAFDVTEELAKELLASLNFNSDLTKWSESDVMELVKSIRRKTKPIVIAANKVDLPGAMENYNRLKIEFPEYTIMPIAAEAELALREAANHGFIKYIPGASNFNAEKELSIAQEKGLSYIKSNVLGICGSTGVQSLLDRVVFGVLRQIAVFPGGVNKLSDSEGRVLPDCFLIKDGSTAFDFAEKIHTDLAKGFIRAIDVRTKKTLGKDHVLLHRDVIEIVSSK